MKLFRDDAVWQSLQVLVVYTSLQYTRHLSSLFPSVSSDTPGCDGPCCARAGLRLLQVRLVYTSFQDMTSVYILFQIALFSEVEWAAALGPLRSWSWCSGSVPEVRMVCNSEQDTRHNLAVPLARFSFWSVIVVRACFVFECSRARFVCSESAVFLSVHPCAIIGVGGRGILLSIGALFPSPEVHFVCRCAALRFFLCEQFVQYCRRFLQRRARRLFLSLRRRNHLVSDVD